LAVRRVCKPADNCRHADELALLPGALETVETSPSPIGRAIALTIIAAFGGVLAWACIGTVDIVAVAPWSGSGWSTGPSKGAVSFGILEREASHAADQ
jgi:hypothetical protein